MVLRDELGACGVTNAVVSSKHKKEKMAATVLLWKRRGKTSWTVAMTQVGNGVILAQVPPSNHLPP